MKKEFVKIEKEQLDKEELELLDSIRNGEDEDE